DGRRVIVLDPTDIALTHGAALVTRELLSQIGFNVDLQAMDWSSVVARRAKKEPPPAGWNLLFTWWIASDVINPAVHAGISGAGDGAWFGWPENGRIEELKIQWARATDRARQKQLAEEIQKIAYDEVMYVPFGQWVLPTADDVAKIRAKLGLDQPFVTQVGIWLGRIVRGDLGTSIYSGLPVTTLIGQRAEATIALTLMSMLISVGVAVPLGVLAAWKKGSLIDRAVMVFAVSGFSMP